ncbi:AzlD domain-containing protein [Janibacter sp. GXQ6167]|uniref:AzlD domain-containing protein n=1 Tax=Janibacter sp. GXQ6167 TaxID=3240791 RepID=UPI003525A871
MTLWITVLASCALAYALKLAGYLVPPSLVDGPRRSSIISLLPVALLTALVVVQTFGGSGGVLVVDARVAGVAMALVLLALGRGFITVVVAAAVVTAGLRALGWG